MSETDAVTEDDVRNLADALPRFAWMATADGDLFWHNRRWYEYTGTTLEEMQSSRNGRRRTVVLS